MRAMHAAFIPKLMGFPLGEGKAKPSLSRSYGEKIHSPLPAHPPPSKEREQRHHCQSRLLPNKGRLETFGADNNSSWKTVCGGHIPEPAQFEMHTTEHAHFKVLAQERKMADTLRWVGGWVGVTYASLGEWRCIESLEHSWACLSYVIKMADMNTSGSLSFCCA